MTVLKPGTKMVPGENWSLRTQVSLWGEPGAPHKVAERRGLLVLD